MFMSEEAEIRQMAAGVVQASFTGPEVPGWLRRHLDGGLGSVCLFGSNLGNVGVAGDRDPTEDPGLAAGRRLAAELHSLRPGVLVALDEEGGDVTRLQAGTGSSLPGNGALGAVADLQLTQHLAGVLGRVLRLVGIDLDLAPVADVTTGAANPAIGVRSFGSSPEEVARQTAAFVEGLQEAGVAACVKHFPGHGATAVDSHLDLPVVDADRELLDQRELVPFRAAVAAGAAAIMTGHLRIPAIDTAPATVSAATLTGLLRDELGYEGLVVTDALDMGGVGGPGAIPANTVRAVAAGADLCCLGPAATAELVTACIDAVADAVTRGQLPAERLAEAAGRVTRLGAETSNARGELDGDLGRALVELQDAGADAAARAIRVEGELPADLTGGHVIELAREPMVAAGEVPWGIGTLWAQVDSTVTWEQADAGTGIDDLVAPAAGRPLVVAVRGVQGRPEQARQLSGLFAARPDAVLVDMGWPDADGSPEPRPAARVLTFGSSRACRAAAVALLTDPSPPDRTTRSGPSPQEDTLWPG
jgi:beta-N-acetylhexosaminidase